MIKVRTPTITTLVTSKEQLDENKHVNSYVIQGFYDQARRNLEAEHGLDNATLNINSEPGVNLALVLTYSSFSYPKELQPEQEIEIQSHFEMHRRSKLYIMSAHTLLVEGTALGHASYMHVFHKRIGDAPARIQKDPMKELYERLGFEG